MVSDLIDDGLARARRPEPDDRSVDEVLAEELAAARSREDGRLSPERELAARFGLTRASVRRWLDDLERAGQVTRHVGRGTFLVPDVQPDPMLTSPAEIMAVRLLLEPQMLGLAVANATAADIDVMRQCLKEGAAAPGFEEFEIWDSQLHAALANATHNGLLVRLFTTMNEARDHPLWGSVKRRSFTDERRAQYQLDHHELVDAIDDRDGEAAATVMRRHLLRIRGALLGADG